MKNTVIIAAKKQLESLFFKNFNVNILKLYTYIYVSVYGVCVYT